MKTFIFSYDYDPKSEQIRLKCDGQRYTKSVFSWETKNVGDTAYVFWIQDLETVELSDGKITPILNPITYNLEINQNG